MKKTISLFLCIIMIISSLAITAFAQAGLSNFQKTLTYTQGKFTDVSADDWFSLNVEAAYEYGLMNGRTSGSFGASDNVKISEVLVLAARLRSIYMTGSTNFAPSTPWYQTYVDFAVSNEIISSGQYKDYNAYATRYQCAEILAASLPSAAFEEINTINIGDIPDVQQTGSYQSIYTLYRAGILTGNDTAGTFGPTAYVLRSEVAALATRMANEDLRVKFTIEKSGNNDAQAQLMATLGTARDEVLLALDYFNSAYSSATSSNFVSAGASITKATTHAQMAAQYAKSAADACKANSSYSSMYDDVNSSYKKCLEFISSMAAITAAEYSPSADWASARTLLNDSASALLTAYASVR